MKKKLERTPFQRIYTKLRKDSHIKQGEVARFTGNAQPAVSKWEKGETEPSLANLVKVADLLGCSTDYLLGRTEIKDSPVTIHGNQNAANIVNSTVEIDGGECARKDAEIARLTRECERLSAECERRFRNAQP